MEDEWADAKAGKWVCKSAAPLAAETAAYLVVKWACEMAGLWADVRVAEMAASKDGKMAELKAPLSAASLAV